MKKIAFCFLIYDLINQEELWHLFLEKVDPNKYTVYIHYKTNKPLKYFEKYKLPHCIATKYADISIVKAQNLLLAKAMEDSANQHFIFISNSCIPLKSFEHIYNNLKEEFSYFNIAPQAACFLRCKDTLKFIPGKFIQKASQWCILNRKHTALMLDTQENYLKWFTEVPDEHCYITNIFYHNLQHELITTPNVTNDATTFINWKGMVYKYPQVHNELKNYNLITADELSYLLESKCFFGRKFTTNCKFLIDKSKYIERIT